MPSQAPDVLKMVEMSASEILMTNYALQSNENAQQLRFDRIYRLLESTTGEKFENTSDCFDWWRKKNDLVLNNGKLKLNAEYEDETWFVDTRKPEIRKVEDIRIGCS